jgi:23S rRNA pseudouridine1911/1915/1917 synthase
LAGSGRAGSAISQLTVPDEAKGERLDRWLAEQLPDTTRSQVTRLLAEGAVTVDGEKARKGGLRLAGGQQVVVAHPPDPVATPLQPQSIPLEILYEDRDVAVLNKPAGLVVHPAPGHAGGTLLNAILARFPEIDDAEQPDRPGIVHRLDRDTSGVLIIAKSAEARRFLQRQFRRRTTEKEYLALVLGRPETARGTIEGPIGRHPTHRQRRAVIYEGRPAVTHFETVEEFEAATLLRVHPVTGRTHQIRVHLVSIGLPVAGDELYGPRRRRIPELDRHFLHAARLSIVTPDGERRTFETPLPEELENVLQALRG